MRVIRHKVEGIPYNAAKNIGGEITPQIVILHDTAGRLEKGNSARYLQNAPSGVSVHFVIERDGSIEQQVPTNRRAGHAGKSTWQGRSDCNAFSIGIEIVNPGKMRKVSSDAALAWWGEEFPLGYGAQDGIEGEFFTAEISTREHGSGVWMDYTPEQVEAVEALLIALFDGIDSLQDITTHWYVSPGRKIDTNPLFPLDQIRARVLGRDDPSEAVADALSDAEPTDTSVRVVTAGSGLNLRAWPSFNPNVIASIPNGTVVPVLRSGLFEGRRWLRVLFDGREGWIVEKPYTEFA